MEAMSKRERVEAAMRFQETDRVPVYDLLFNDDVIQYFTGTFPPYGEEGAKLQCQAIGRMLDMTRGAGASPREEGERRDEDGFVHYHYRWTSGGIRERPFSDLRGAMEWLKKANRRLEEQNKSFDPKSTAAAFLDRFHTLTQYIGDDTVILHGQSGTGLDTVRYLLGLEYFSYISVDAPHLLSEYLELSTDLEVKTIHAIADRRLSPCTLTYGDIAIKGGLMHSPAWLKAEFLPRLQRLNDAWHDHGILCLFHSDGDLMPIMPELLATGIDGLNPIETTAGMEIAEVRRLYGQQVFLAGGIDISTLMSFGTPDEVRRECERAIAEAGPGYFIGSTTELDNGSKLENVLTMLEVAWNKKLRVTP